MAIDWTEMDNLRKPARREVVEFVDKLDDAALDTLLLEHVAPKLDPKLRPDQKEQAMVEAKKRFRDMSDTDTPIITLLGDCRDFVTRWSPTVLPPEGDKAKTL